MENNKLKDKGFTLIEILVVMAVFSIVVTLSIGIIMQVFSVNQKVRSVSSVMDNVSTGLETMTIELRYGGDYQCDSLEGCDSISFRGHDDRKIRYFLEDGAILRSTEGGIPRKLSTPEATISNLRFYVHNDLLVTVVIKGEVGRGPEGSTFSLQTAVAQRQRYEVF